MQPGNTIHPPGPESLALAIVRQARRDMRKNPKQTLEAREFLASLLDLTGHGNLEERL